MVVYEGLAYVLRDRVVVHFLDLDSMGGIARPRDYDLEEFPNSSHENIIRIGNDFSVDEQIKTIIHEFIHFSPKYLGDMDVFADKSQKDKAIELEKAIECETLEVFREQPVLVDFVRGVYVTKEFNDLEDFLIYRKDKF